MGSVDAATLVASELGCLRGDRVLFAGLSFQVQAGEILLISGANGVGKSSLMRILCGLLPADTGEVHWRGRAIDGGRPEYLADLCYVGHQDGVKRELTARENLEVARALQSGDGDPETALLRMGIATLAEVPGYRLSAGQRRRLALARLLVAQRRLWLLDEPFTALDRPAAHNLVVMLREHARDGGVAVLTSHQPIDLPEAKPLVLGAGP
ncbi:MAG: cytochrome c biogenesis heme-transporting ATPase CcmA [Gammaproteobacteria bacterium]